MNLIKTIATKSTYAHPTSAVVHPIHATPCVMVPPTLVGVGDRKMGYLCIFLII